ncbi:MAG: FadR/GntR family transcriptional regulator [Planctomycetota bacterium]
MSAPLGPIEPRETAVEACERALRRAILEGELPPGERLPAERALAERLGVNRVTLRGALARLAATGLLRTRQGSGTVVSDFREVGGLELLPGLAALCEGPGFLELAADLLRIRRHLARAVLERVLEAEQLDLSPIAAAVERFAAVGARTRDPLELAHADLDVIGALVEASGSLVLRLCLNPVAAALQALPALRAAIYVDPSENLAGYRALLTWLEEPDPAGVELLVSVLQQGDAQTLTRLRAALAPEGGAS